MSMDSRLRRLAVMLILSERKQAISGQFGKTAMQKLLYLLQECHGVDLGYRFGMYTYGPYQSMVMADIDYADTLGVLEVDSSPEMGYQLRPGRRAASMDRYRQAVQQELGTKIDDLLDRVGTATATELELQATIVYAARDKQNQGMSDGDLVKLTKELKRKFSKSEIRKAVRKLREWNCI